MKLFQLILIKPQVTYEQAPRSLFLMLGKTFHTRRYVKQKKMLSYFHLEKSLLNKFCSFCAMISFDLSRLDNFSFHCLAKQTISS